MEVVKIGGSLFEHLAQLGPTLCAADVLVVPGGGLFANAVREVDSKFGLSPDASHRMAILGMDQYGWMIADRTGLPVTHHPTAELPAVFLPARWISEDDPFPPSWDVTSDSIAAWTAHRLGLSRLLLLKVLLPTDQDEPGEMDLSQFRARAEVSQLVDPEFPSCLQRWNLTAWILNGRAPDSLSRALSGQSVGRRVLPE